MEAISQGPMRNSAHFGWVDRGRSNAWRACEVHWFLRFVAISSSLYFLNAAAPLFGRREGAGTISLSKVIPVVAVSKHRVLAVSR